MYLISRKEIPAASATIFCVNRCFSRNPRTRLANSLRSLSIMLTMAAPRLHLVLCFPLVYQSRKGVHAIAAGRGSGQLTPFQAGSWGALPKGRDVGPNRVAAGLGESYANPCLR
jgi:hypothetical protein